MAAEGYESASLGVWGWLTTLQAIIGILCYTLSCILSPYEELQQSASRQIALVKATTFTALATAAFASASIMLICAVLSYFVVPRLSHLLLGLSGLLSIAAALAAAIIMGKIITKAVSCMAAMCEYLKKRDENPNCDYTTSFVLGQKPALGGIGIAAIISVTLTLRALVMRSTATAVDGILYSACLAVAAALCACTVLLKEAVPPLLVFGVFWVVGTVLLLAFLQQQKICWPRFTSIALALLSAVLALLGIVTASFCIKRCTDDKLFAYAVSSPQSIVPLIEGAKDDDFDRLKSAVLASANYDYVVGGVLGTAAAICFAASALASFRAVLGPSPAEKEMAQESAEQAVGR